MRCMCVCLCVYLYIHLLTNAIPKVVNPLSALRYNNVHSMRTNFFFISFNCSSFKLHHLSGCLCVNYSVHLNLNKHTKICTNHTKRLCSNDIIICILHYNIMFQGLSRNTMSCGDLSKWDLDYSCYGVMLIKFNVIYYYIVMI